MVAVLVGVVGCSSAGSPPVPAPSPNAAVSSANPGPNSPKTVRRQSAGSARILASRESWTLPAAISREVVITDGNSAVVAGGLTVGDASTSRVFRVDLRRGQAAPMSKLPEPLHDSAGVLVGGQPTVIGGGGATELAAVEQYGPGHRWRTVGRLPLPRSDLSVVAVPDGFLVVGGYDGAVSRREVLKGDTAQAFHGYARLVVGVRYTAAVSFGGSVWIFGGEDRNRELRTIQRVDLASGAVTTVGRLPSALGHAAAAVVGSRILLMGGRTAPSRVSDTMWWFDPATHRFSGAGRLPYPVADAGVAVTSDGIYLLGGETPQFPRSVIRVRVG